MTEKFEVAGYGELEELIDAQCASIDWLTVTAKDEEHQRLLLSEAQRLFSASKAAGNVQRPWKFSGYDGWSIQGVPTIVATKLPWSLNISGRFGR